MFMKNKNLDVILIFQQEIENIFEINLHYSETFKTCFYALNIGLF